VAEDAGGAASAMGSSPQTSGGMRHPWTMDCKFLQACLGHEGSGRVACESGGPCASKLSTPACQGASAAA